MKRSVKTTGSYYVADVVISGDPILRYIGRVGCEHPNGYTEHFEKRFMFKWLARMVVNSIAKRKSKYLDPVWEKEFKS